MAKETKKKTVKAKGEATPMASVETPVIGWAIQQPEYDARLARVRAILDERKLDALVLFHPIRMAYVSGFFHLSTERPMAIVIGPNGTTRRADPAGWSRSISPSRRRSPTSRSILNIRPAAPSIR